MPCFLEETFEDIKGEIRSRKLKNSIKQWHKKKKKQQRRSNAVQNTTEKTKNRATRIR
jgi:hypothetical protein